MGFVNVVNLVRCRSEGLFLRWTLAGNWSEDTAESRMVQ